MSLIESTRSRDNDPIMEKLFGTPFSGRLVLLITSLRWRPGQSGADVVVQIGSDACADAFELKQSAQSGAVTE